MSCPSSILCFGSDPILVKTRQQLFAGAGYDSHRAENFDELRRSFRERAFDVLLICHSVASAEREAAKQLALSQTFPTRVLILNKGIQSAKDEGETSFDSLKGPARLLDAIEALLKRNRTLET